MKFIIVILLLSSCSNCSYEENYGIDYYTKYKEGQEIALELTFDYINAEYITNIDPKVDLYWVNTTCSYDNVDNRTAIVYEDKCYVGLTFSCNYIYLADRGQISYSALAHELLHCAHIEIYKDGDGEHSHTSWWANEGIIDQMYVEAGL